MNAGRGTLNNAGVNIDFEARLVYIDFCNLFIYFERRIDGFTFGISFEKLGIFFLSFLLGLGGLGSSREVSLI